MNTDIRVGDKFLIECEVARLENSEWSVVRIGDDGSQFAVSFPNGVLLAGKRLPRAIRVGDRVRWCGGMAIATVVALPDDPDHCGNKQAFVRDASREYFVVPQADLALVDEVSP